MENSAIEDHAKTSITGTMLKRKLGIAKEVAKRWERCYREGVNLGIDGDG
ncbi:MAG: hypothetical protein WCJ37_04620 [Syntrophus sp. (in: bacteria)]